MKIARLLLVLALAYSTQAHALKPEKGLTKEEAVQRAKSQHGNGKVLGITKKQGSTGPEYKVKLLTDKGRVKTISIK